MIAASVGLLAAACTSNPPHGSKAAVAPQPIGHTHTIRACRAATISEPSKLRAGFDTTSKVVVDWLNSKNPPNFGRIVPQFFENRPDADPIALCFVDGVFGRSGGPGGVQADRGVRAVDAKGEVADVVSAFHDKLPLVRPEDALKHPTTTTVPRGAIALPGYAIDHGFPDGVLDGVGIAGDATLGCVWVTVGGVRHAAVWTPGAIARFNPVRIYDAQSVLRWTEGEVRRVQGGTSTETDNCQDPRPMSDRSRAR